MKILSFSAVEVLPALLNRTKTQTIRPLFCENCWQGNIPPFEDVMSKCPPDWHKTHFKVGEKVKLYWKQRSIYKWFSIFDGSPLIDDKGLEPERTLFFPKLLGEAEITEVFEMWMGKSYSIKIDEYKDLAKRDGFSSWEDMQRWFEMRYFFMSPSDKKFAVYRWKGL